MAKATRAATVVWTCLSDTSLATDSAYSLYTCEFFEPIYSLTSMDYIQKEII